MPVPDKGLFKEGLADLPQDLKRLMVKAQVAEDEDKALKVWSELQLRRIDRKFKGLEFARMPFKPGYDNLKALGYNVTLKWDRLARRWITPWDNYFMESYRRIYQKALMGDEDEIFRKLYTSLATEFPDEADIARRTWFRLTDRDSVDGVLRNVVQGINTLSTLAWMGTSQIMQLGSIPNVLIRNGFINGFVGFYKGLKSLFRNADREFVEETGTIYLNMLHDIRQLGQSTRFGDFYLRLLGTTKFDEITRLIAAHSARRYITRAIQRKDMKAINEIASELNLNTRLLLDQNKDEMLLAIKRMVDTTIGRTRVTELPLWWSSPYASFITLFKNYLKFHTDFMYKQVLKKPRKWIPALFATMPFGEVIGDLRAFIRDRERPKGFDRIIDNLLLVQFLGLAGDAMIAAGVNEKRVLSFLAGANLTNIAGWASALADSLEKVADGKLRARDHKKLLKKWIELIPEPPLVGPRIRTTLRDWLFPEDERLRELRGRQGFRR